MTSNQQKVWDIEYKKGVKWGRETQTLPRLLKGKNVLELGVGNGKTLISIIKQKPLKITAVDFSQEAISSCKLLFSSKKVSLIRADIKKMPFKDEEFDFVVCYYILDGLLKKDRIKAVKEIYRVLKPKGAVLLEDFAVGDFREPGKIKQIESHTCQKPNGLIQHFFSARETFQLFKDFSDIKTKIKSSRQFRSRPARKIISCTIQK